MCLLNIFNLLIHCIVFQLLDRPVSASKIQYGLSYTPQCRSLTQILHQKGFVVFFLQSRHAVVHHQLRLLRQIYSHFWLDPTKQEGLQDPLQLSSCKQKDRTRDTVCQCWFNKQLTRLFFLPRRPFPQHQTHLKLRNNLFQNLPVQNITLNGSHVCINIAEILN